MNTEEILLLTTLLATTIIGVVGFVLTIYQIKKSNKVKKAEFFNKILENIRLNERIIDAIYLIDYDKLWYTEAFHNSGDLEKNIDALFSQIDYVCYLFSEKLLNETEFAVFKYEVMRIVNNNQCKCYLWNLYHWSQRNNTPTSFNHLIDFLKSQFNESELKRFEDYHANSIYKKNLNF